MPTPDMAALQSKSKRLLAFALLLSLSIACNLLHVARQGLEEAIATAMTIATEAEGGREVLTTAQALVTQIVGRSWSETAQALATEVNRSGLHETLQAVLTQQVPGLDETLQAFLTQEVFRLEETAKATSTPVPSLSPAALEDIPLIEGDKENLILTPHTITYIAAMPYIEVVAFYKREMPRRGWTYQPESSQELSDISLLNYTKADRQASISISFAAAQKTVVTIVLQAQQTPMKERPR